MVIRNIVNDCKPFCAFNACILAASGGNIWTVFPTRYNAWSDYILSVAMLVTHNLKSLRTLTLVTLVTYIWLWWSCIAHGYDFRFTAPENISHIRRKLYLQFFLNIFSNNHLIVIMSAVCNPSSGHWTSLEVWCVTFAGNILLIY